MLFNSFSMDVQRILEGFPIDFPWMFNGFLVQVVKLVRCDHSTF